MTNMGAKSSTLSLQRLARCSYQTGAVHDRCMPWNRCGAVVMQGHARVMRSLVIAVVFVTLALANSTEDDVVEIVVNDVEAPTLGDGDRNDPVLAHDYWGTKKIIADLAKISIFTGSKTIILDAKENTVLKDGAGNDVGILHEALL